MSNLGIDLSIAREYVKKLHCAGYDEAARSILQGMTRVICINDDKDWNNFKYEFSNHDHKAWYGSDLHTFITDQTLASFAVSYRHAGDWKVREPKGNTLTPEMWNRLRHTIQGFMETYCASRVVLWMDQILECSKSITEGVNWVTKGVLPYMVLPVLYVGGEIDSTVADRTNQNRVWVAIERMAALTNCGISLQGTSKKGPVMVGASLTLPQALLWLSSRVLGGCFNQCELSWIRDYLSFRELAVGILREKNNPLSAVEGFLKTPSKVPPKPDFTTMDAFNFSADSEDMTFGRGHPYFGTYLAAKVKNFGNRWHGLREWVQYKWNDGVLLEESREERQQIIDLTKWFIFDDNNDNNKKYALGLVSMQGEVGALGVAHLSNAGDPRYANVIWFQRGLSPLARHYTRGLFYSGKLGDPYKPDVCKHWNISLGKQTNFVRGSEVKWKW